MVKGGHPPVFALALSRDIERSFITLGGVPDIETEEYASAPLVPVRADSLVPVVELILTPLLLGG